MLARLQSARYELAPERSVAYRAFLARLLCVEPARRCTAAAALHDPWVLGDDWTAGTVDGLLATQAAGRGR
jgi:hypothetical protein